MSCERYADALTSAAAGGPVPSRLEAHLASCDGCRRDLAELRRALALADAEVSGLARAEPSAGLAGRILQAVAAPEPAPKGRAGWLWPAAAVAALAALAAWVIRAPVAGPGMVHTGAPGAAMPIDTGDEDGAGEPPSAPSVPSARREPPGPPAMPSRVPAAPRGVRRTPSAPEVLVPPGDAEALARFAAELQHRAVARDSILLADLSAPLTRPKAIEIPPLEIEPLHPDTSGTD